jgi:hypothetical protein
MDEVKGLTRIVDGRGRRGGSGAIVCRKDYSSFSRTQHQWASKPLTFIEERPGGIFEEFSSF